MIGRTAARFHGARCRLTSASADGALSGRRYVRVLALVSALLARGEVNAATLESAHLSVEYVSAAACRVRIDWLQLLSRKAGAALPSQTCVTPIWTQP